MGYRAFKKKSIPIEAIDGTLGRSINSTGNISNIPSVDDRVRWVNVEAATIGYSSPYWDPSDSTWKFGVMTLASAHNGHIIVVASDIVLGHVRKGSGVAIDGDGHVSIKVDNATVEIASDTVRVKDEGITAAKLGVAAATTVKIADKAVTPAKLEDGPAGDTAFLWWSGDSWSVQPLGAEEWSRWEQGAGTSLSGPSAGWVELDFPGNILGDSGQVDRTGGVWIYTPLQPGYFHINFWFRLVGLPAFPPNAWSDANIEIGYRIDTINSLGVVTTGTWVELDRRWFTTAQPDCTCVGSALVLLELIEPEGPTGTSRLLFGYRSHNALPMSFPAWRGRVEVRRPESI